MRYYLTDRENEPLDRSKGISLGNRWQERLDTLKLDLGLGKFLISRCNRGPGFAG